MLVRALRISELQDGDMLVFEAGTFSSNEALLTACNAIMANCRKRGITISPNILICRPGHSEDFFSIDEKQLNEHGFYKQ